MTAAPQMHHTYMKRGVRNADVMGLGRRETGSGPGGIAGGAHDGRRVSHGTQPGEPSAVTTSRTAVPGEGRGRRAERQPATPAGVYDSESTARFLGCGFCALSRHMCTHVSRGRWKRRISGLSSFSALLRPQRINLPRAQLPQCNHLIRTFSFSHVFPIRGLLTYFSEHPPLQFSSPTVRRM